MKLSNPLAIAELFIGVFMVAMIVTWALTYGVRAFASWAGVVAHRDGRRRHQFDTPLLGGTSIYAVLVLGTVGLFSLQKWTPYQFITLRFGLCFLIAISILFVVGVIDDWIELKALPKSIAQVLAAILILGSEPHLPSLLRSTHLPEIISVPLLIFWIVGIINAMNMIDGLDGLCSGIGAISAITLTAIFLTLGGAPDSTAVITVMLAGACIGFLFHNAHPAKIFLGDSGSMLIGFVLAVVSVKVEFKRSLFISLSLPIFLLGLPLLDAGLSIIRRKIRDRSLFKGDRSHIHHRLYQVGLDHRKAVIFMWLASAYLNASAFFLAHVQMGHAIYIYASTVPTIGFWIIALYFIERRLTYQMARFGHLFMKQEIRSLEDRNRLVTYLKKRVHDYRQYRRPFFILSVDCASFLSEMAHENPNRVIAFYMSLYGILSGPLQSEDLIARISNHRFLAIFSGAKGMASLQMIENLASEIKTLEESYLIFQSDPVRPEGFKILSYPEDRERIWHSLGLEEREIETAPLSKHMRVA